MNEIINFFSSLWWETDWFFPVVCASPWLIMLVVARLCRDPEEEARITNISCPNEQNEAWQQYYGPWVAAWILAPLALIFMGGCGICAFLEWLTRPRKSLSSVGRDNITWKLEQEATGSNYWHLHCCRDNGKVPITATLRSVDGPPSKARIRRAKRAILAGIEATQNVQNI